MPVLKAVDAVVVPYTVPNAVGVAAEAPPLTVANTSGTLNVAVGGGEVGSAYGSLGSNTTGSNNTAIGLQALLNNTTANNNTAVGYRALYSNTTASNNVALGRESLYTSTTADSNVSTGYRAGYLVTTGGGNSLYGDQAGSALTTGTNNVCIGNATGNVNTGLTTGTDNILIGRNVDVSSSSSTYEIVIAASASNSSKVGKGAGTGFIQPNGGGVYQGNNSSSWSTTSDQRLKKNIADNNDGLDKINSIRVRNFEYRLPEEVTELPEAQAIQKSGVQLGVIAQELQAVLPDCVKTESTGVMTVDQDNLTWYLINAVKELSARVKQLEGN